jgi:hypothetical protein
VHFLIKQKVQGPGGPRAGKIKVKFLTDSLNACLSAYKLSCQVDVKRILQSGLIKNPLRKFLNEALKRKSEAKALCGSLFFL